jgi:hypothetical protein
MIHASRDGQGKGAAAPGSGGGVPFPERFSDRFRDAGLRCGPGRVAVDVARANTRARARHACWQRKVSVFGTCSGESRFATKGEDREAQTRTGYGARTANALR